MNPPRSFKFRFKINGTCRMRAQCVRARFRDRSRPCFIACAFDVHATFKHLIVAERARPCSSGPGELLTALSRRGQCGSFRCKTVSTSVRKGAMTRRRALTATLFSLQNEERRVQSHRFSGRFAYGEGISERNPASKIDQHRRRSTSGRCWAAVDRSSAAKGDSLRVTPFADEKKVRLFTACDDVYAWSPDVRKWCRMAVNDAFAACVAGYGSHSPEVLHFGSFGRSARVAGKTSLTQQISHA